MTFRVHEYQPHDSDLPYGEAAAAALGVDLIVVPARMLRLNPLQLPDHLDPHNWASRVADLLVQVFRLPTRATKLLQLMVIDLFDRFGVLREIGKHTSELQSH